MSNFIHDRDVLGAAGESFFYANCAVIINLKSQVKVEKLPQKEHNEGDFKCRVSDPQRYYIDEVKSDTDGGFLRYGNVLVQIANDSCTDRGWLCDIQVSDPMVDLLTYVLFADPGCKRPYAAISVWVPDFVRLFGCSGSGCDQCGKCVHPSDPGWKNCFPQFRRSETLIMLNVFNDLLPNCRTRIVIFDDLHDMDLDQWQRRNLERLIQAADLICLTDYIIPLHDGGQLDVS